jgi:hypothetical protein
MRTRIWCEGLCRRRQNHVAWPPGTGVAMSCGVYLKLTAYIFVLGLALSKLGESGRMPRPFVVVVSGKTQMILLGFCAVSCWRV